MVSLTRQHVAVTLVALLVATGFVATAATADRTLVVADADSGERLLERPVDDGTEVTLSYTHSVEKTPVHDVYVVDGTEIRMDRMVFSSYGAGLPATEPIERTEDGFVVSVDRSYEELYVSPGSIAGHELVIEGDRYDLVALSDGKSVVLYVTDRSLRDALHARFVDVLP